MDTQERSESDSPAHNVARVVERNIEALVARSERANRERSFEQRVADQITRFAGSMPFVYVHLVVYGLWVVINLGWLPLPKFDPTFVVLAMVASVEAIFLSTFILITQNRMAEMSQKRADLDLQISLLAEYETTQMLKLVKEMATKMDVGAAQNPELTDLQQDVSPEKVLDALERRHPEP